MLYTYSIMPLNDDHFDEVVADAADQYRRNISTCPMFCIKIHAEGKPAIPKAKIECERYDRFRDALEAMGVPSGLLVQSTIGHGYALDEGIGFSPYVEFKTGEETAVACPLDPDWLGYMRDSMAEIARHRPRAIMLDDDCRLLNRPGRGCACPRHMAEFNRRAGTHMTRAELYAHVTSHPDDDPLTAVFLQLQRDSIRGAMIAMREGVDSVDPAIQGINCLTHRTCEIVTDALGIFAGGDNPVIVRLPNGSYAPLTARGFSEMMMRTSATVAALRGKADVILAETDTIPFNRYGKSAVYLKGHFACTLLDGCAGAKHWITRLCAHEPKSGRAFRDVLAENAGFFDALSSLAKEITPVGACIPFAPSFYRYSRENFWAISDSSFADCVLERMGIPFYFSDTVGKSTWISGDGAKDLSDDTLRRMFRGAVFLASDTAEELISRGFSDEIGVRVEKWDGVSVSGELFENGNTCSKQVGIRALVPTDGRTRTLSAAYHLEGGKTKKPLFPAVALFEKGDGSFTVTFAGTPKAQFNYMEAFAFLNETRKDQLVSLMKKAGALPVYSDSDSEIMLRAWTLPDGDLLVGQWNLSWDVHPECSLVTERAVCAVRRLLSDGTWAPVPFDTEGERTVISVEMRPLDPIVLRLTLK